MNNDQLFQKQLSDLYEALEKDDIAGSARLIEQIGDAGNALALEPLLILLGFHDERVRSSSATALGKLGMGPAVEPLIGALKDPSFIVQEKAAIALGIIGDERATGPLENVTPDNSRVKAAAEYSLLQIGNKNKKDSLFKKYSTGGSPVIIKPPRPVAADGGQAYSPKPAAPPVRKIESPPPDVSASTPVKQVATPGIVSDGGEEELPPKSPLIAALASFFIPGLGQLYNGEKFTRALLFSFAYVIGSILLVVPGLLVWLYGIYNAYTTAKKINAGELPNRKPNLLLMLILVPCMVMIVVVLTIVMAAVIAAFVFQMGSDMPDNHFNALPVIMASRIDPNTVKITNMGGGDTSLTGLRVIVNGTEISPISGRLTPKDGSFGTYTVRTNIPVTVMADFGADQMVVYNMPV